MSGERRFTTEWLEKWASKQAAANRGTKPGHPPAPPGPSGPDRPKLERRPRHGADGKAHAQAGHPGRYLVRIESFRVRLLDTDNGCEKYATDSLRYAGVIPDDNARNVQIVWLQTKVATPEEERTVIEIYPPGTYQKCPHCESSPSPSETLLPAASK